MKTVLLRAPVLTASGYGVHARQVARWLFETAAQKHDLDISVQPLRWGQTHWITDVDAQDGLIKNIVQAASNEKKFYDVTIQLQLPNEWNPFLGVYNIGMTAGVETHICNPKWVEMVNKMDLVIVPSEFTKSAFMKSGVVETRIEVVPEAFPDEFLSEEVVELPLDLKTKFNFLVFGQFTGNSVDNDRKNLGYTIKWLTEQFAGNPEVGIILKTNMGCNSKLDRRVVTNICNKILTECRADNLGPEFHLLHGDMTPSELKALYTHPTVKALVSFTHGEGFGLPLLEAAACNLPVIATNWSAHTEFLKAKKSMLVECNISKIHSTRVDNEIFMPDAEWAYPLEAFAKKRLQKFYENPKLPKEWANSLGEKVRKEYCFSAISAKYDALLDEVMK
jgi:glycosyltransferase involved in cell wall biosynthesis